jgi:hypothetical protein
MDIIQQNIIIKMYVEDMLSAVQISERIDCSVSVIVRILEKNNIQKRSISDAVTQLNITKFHKVPFQLKHDLSPAEDDLKLTGIMLYWGEGAKTGDGVKFANSNPEMILIFLMFLRKICGADEGRIKMMIHFYPDQKIDFLKKFWSSATGVSLESFYRPHALMGKTGTYKNKSIYGTATVHYSDKKLLTLILRWIENYKNGFLKLPE